MMNLMIFSALGLVFPLLIYGTFKHPSIGLAILLSGIPLFSLSRRLFPSDAMPFPSLETWAVIIFWVCVQFRNIKYKAPILSDSWNKIMSCLFVIAALLSSLVSDNVDSSLKILLAGGISPLLCYSIASRYVRELKTAQIVIYGFLLLVIQTVVFSLLAFDKRVTIVSDVQELVPFLYHEANPVALFGAPSVSMAVIVSAIPLASWYRLYGKWQKTLVWAIITGGVLVTSILSLSRGSILGVLVAVVASLPFYFRKRSETMLLAVFILIPIWYMLGDSGFFKMAVEYRIRQSGFGNFDIRAMNNLLALQSASRHPFLGLGLGSYPEVYQEFPLAPASQTVPLVFAHSLLLTLIPEIGLLGAIGFAGFYLTPIVKGMRSLSSIPEGPVRWLVYALCVGLVSYLVIASTAGAYVIASLAWPVSSNYMIAPALVVAFSFLGILTGLRSGMNSRIGYGKGIRGVG